MTVRLARFVAASYPPLAYLVTTLLWACGLTGLAAAADGRAAWSPGLGLAVTVLTLFVGMLVIRALDDIRDLAYDREHNPRRPLPSGVVRVSDLVLLAGVGMGVMLLANAWRGVAALVLAGHLAYLVALVGVNVLLRWPATENLLVQLPLNLPVQLLLCGYVYAAFLTDHDRPVTGHGLVGVAAVVFVLVHLEFARRATRQPRASERTYVQQLGLAGTLGVAGAAAVLSALCAVIAVRPAGAAGGRWGWLAVVPLAFPVLAGARFWGARLPRWPVSPTLGFVLCSFAVFLALGVLAGDHP
ncbi:MAG TPA: hypothetical protein VFB84_10430 [Micromonosporaceae bacterium]|nr:hypothetical protein [Micromonosporaceae bacterium]